VHSDMVIICALWDVDHATDMARERLRGLKQAVDDAVAEEARIASEQARVSKAIAEGTAHEQSLDGQLTRYVKRRDKAAKLMEGGSALDYLAVERQHIQCGEKVDQLELAVLDCMEVQEALESEAQALSTSAAAARAHAESVQAEWVREGRLIGSEFKRLDAERASMWADFPGDLRRHYKDMRRRKSSVVTEIIDGNCSGCSMTVNAQVMIETRLGRRVHTCRGCHRWFRGVAGTESVDGAVVDA